MNIAASLHSYSGGYLPPPDVLAKYDQIVKDGAERLMRLAEGQSAHRQAMEKSVVDEGLKQSREGLRIFGVLGVLILIVAIVMVLTGQPLYGLAAVVTPVAILAGALRYGLSEAVRERIAKSKYMSQLKQIAGIGTESSPGGGDGKDA
ncbi:MAG: DUF2335 domain-containing protein [Candidatus Dormibacteria bacterium]